MRNSLNATPAVQSYALYYKVVGLETTRLGVRREGASFLGGVGVLEWILEAEPPRIGC
jgi:hypothetical protein